MDNQYQHPSPPPPPHDVAVVVVPLPAQGHINQLFHLSRLIVAYDIPVHIVGTTIHNHQAKARLQGWDPNSIPNIHFHNFTIPSFPSPPPNPSLQQTFPSHLLPSFRATSHLRHPTAALLRRLSSQTRRVVVIHDSLMASVVQDVVSIQNAESYTFHSVSAFAIFLFYYDGMKKTTSLLEVEESVENIPKDIPSLEGCMNSEILEFIAGQYEFNKLNSGNLYNTSRMLERPYMNLLDRILPNKKHWAVGPFNPVSFLSNDRHVCLKWLDKQEPNSVIYVSFGTTTAFTDEQISELAFGLQKSNQKFIWVLREADKGNVFEAVKKLQLPKGYEERVRNFGLVVREWAPQLEILGHPSTGGFLSHCGWNSCVESITMGVPIGTWPMHSDQPRNAVLVTKLLRIGVVVREWSKRDDVARSDTVACGVRRLMASDEGVEMRKRAAELGGALRRSMAEGGSSRKELDCFIAHISR
ncbi:zeatin O-glucosyltransferase [Cannabis sativa]|uniref:zeatin O-glucosyltransferase n=1 Tax=Cannabis sativa TaxID=3483 RepID=UPI0029CA87D6|nr:zeatin O-glucosyltransferase [Cannabis sativa]